MNRLSFSNRFAMSVAKLLSAVCLMLFLSGNIALANPFAQKTKPKAPAQSDKQKNKNVQKTNSAKSRANTGAITDEREAAALQFAKKHHPELVGLIEGLKDTRKSQYTRAIRDLTLTSERLGKIKERIPDRYKRDLEAWKLDSRVRLVMARLQMADPSEVDSLRAQLLKLVTQRTKIRLEQLTEEKAKLTSRLEKLDQTIGTMDNDEFITKEMDRLQKSLSNNQKRESLAAKKRSAAESKSKKAVSARNAAKKKPAQKKPARKNKTNKK